MELNNFNEFLGNNGISFVQTAYANGSSAKYIKDH